MNRKMLLFGLIVVLALIAYWMTENRTKEEGDGPDLAEEQPSEEYIVGKDIPLEEIEYFLISESGMSRFSGYSFELRKEGGSMEMEARYFPKMEEGGEEVAKNCILTEEQWEELTSLLKGQKLRYPIRSKSGSPVPDAKQRTLSLRWRTMKEEQREMSLYFEEEERLEKLRLWLMETAEKAEALE